LNWQDPPYTVYKSCNLQSPSLLTGFNNEIGNIAGIAFQTIGVVSGRNRLGALKLNDFFLFNGVRVEDSVILFPECDFYTYDSGNMLLFMGDAPNKEPFDYCNAILDFAVKQCRVEEVITIGGFISPICHTSPRRVFGTVTKPELRMFLTPYDINVDVNYHTPPSGPRPSLNHFLLWAAKMREIPGYSLWVEVPFYLANLKDPFGAKAMLEVLDKRFVLGLDYTEIEEKVSQLNKKITDLMNQNSDVNRFIKLLDQGIALSHEESENLARAVLSHLKRVN